MLLGAPRADCVVPKSSAGQGLRAILNTYDAVPRVVATKGEFDSLDVILREYARRGRIALTLVEPRSDGRFDTADIVAAIGARADLVVVSQVIFTTGSGSPTCPTSSRRRTAPAARLLLDVYHALGVFPVDVAALDVDFAVGGSYKYLRGGPGACFLYLHPRHLDGSLRTLDTGWFAKREPFAYLAPRSAAIRRRRRRLSRIDAAGAAVLPGARGTALHAGGGRRPDARAFARVAAATGGLLANAVWTRRAEPRIAAHSSWSPMTAEGWARRCEGGRHHRRARTLPEAVPGHPHDRRRTGRGGGALARTRPKGG